MPGDAQETALLQLDIPFLALPGVLAPPVPGRNPRTTVRTDPPAEAPAPDLCRGSASGSFKHLDRLGRTQTPDWQAPLYLPFLEGRGEVRTLFHPGSGIIRGSTREKWPHEEGVRTMPTLRFRTPYMAVAISFTEHSVDLRQGIDKAIRIPYPVPEEPGLPPDLPAR